MPRKQVAAYLGAAGVFLLFVGFLLFQFVLAPRFAFTTTTTLTVLSGAARVLQAGQTQYKAAQDGMDLRAGDRVKTEATSRAVITFFEGSTMELEPATEVVVTSLLQGRAARASATAIALQQLSGLTWSHISQSADPSSIFQVDTPTAVVLVRGTLLEIAVEPTTGRTEVIARDGQAIARAQGVEVNLLPYTQTKIEPSQPPSPPLPAQGPSERLRVLADAPVWARVVDPFGRATGFIAPGLPVIQVPGSLVHFPFESPKSFELPVTQSGQYNIVLEGGGEGSYRFIVQGVSRDAIVFTHGVQGLIRAEQRFFGTLTLAMQGGRLTSGQLGSFTALVTGGGPGKFVRTQLAVAGVALTATAGALHGTPTPLVTRTPTATPTGTMTPTPTPTDTPTITPTRPAGTSPTRTPTRETTALAAPTATPLPPQAPTGTPSPPAPQASATPSPLPSTPLPPSPTSRPS